MSIPGSASPLFLGAAAVEAGPFQIERSLRFNSDDSAYLNRTPSSAGNRKTWTWSGWVKRANSDSDHHLFVGDKASSESLSNSTFGRFYINSSGQLYFSGYATGYRITSALLRDPAAWYHLVAALDTTQSTADDRVKIYINGVQITDFSTKNNPSQNDDLGWNTATPHTIGARSRSGTIAHYHDGYLAEVHFIDGQQLAASDFGEYDSNNNWNPKAYSGTYGTNGFHLDFSDNSSNAALGTDSSGLSNTWTVNNLSVASGAGNDSLIDTPLAYEADSGNNGGNYCTLNPLHIHNNTNSNAKAKNGNLVWGGTNHIHHVIAGTFSISSGKWYWEATFTNASSNYVAIGMCKADYKMTPIIPGYDETEAFSVYSTGGKYYYNSTSEISYGTGWTVGDVIGVRYDEGAVYFYKNGTIMNASPILTLTGSWCPLFHTYDTGEWTVNFGQRPFAQTVPTNHKALVSYNLPDPAVANGADHFYPLASTGTFGGGTVTDSNAGFTPDLVWVKRRNAAERHKLYDILRGTDGTRYKHLEPDGDDAEGSGESGITSFVAGGYTSEGGGHINSDGQPFISWMWNAGTSTVTNTDGNVSVNLRANPTAGISIATYTGNQSSGATIGHGLNDAPAWWVMKSYSHSGMWVLRHKDVANNYYLQWDTDHAPRDATSDVTGDADSTNSVVPIGAADANNSGRTHLALMFAPVPGFSAFGKYKGNGDTSGLGPFINLGFRPAWVMFKNVSAVSNYRIFDSARDPYNYVDHRLFVDSTSAESQNTTQRVDFLSNGFRVLGNSSASTFNINNHEIIYFAFAEHPFKTARAR